MPSSHRRLLAAALLLAAAAALGGCGSDAEEPRAGGSTRAASTPSSGSPTAASPTRQRSEPPPESLRGPLRRCGPLRPPVARTGFRYGVLRDPEVGAIATATAGHGRTVAVLLHQTDRNGLCGWLPFAARIADRPGLTALALDLCGYGATRCRSARDGSASYPQQLDAVAVAIAHAREQLGATRVVIVGASLGGSLALGSAARLPGVDAAVDLSGATGTFDHGRRLRVPVLVAMARSEGEIAVRHARASVTHAPPGSRFLGAANGHGYDLLLDSDGRPRRLAAPVLAWISRAAG